VELAETQEYTHPRVAHLRRLPNRGNGGLVWLVRVPYRHNQRTKSRGWEHPRFFEAFSHGAFECATEVKMDKTLLEAEEGGHEEDGPSVGL
jgi:hypothetical protein